MTFTNCFSPRISIILIGIIICLPLSRNLHSDEKSHSSKEVTQARSELDWGGEFDLAILYGDIRGSLQTPRGGLPGTTSGHRPTLDEIGVETLTSGKLKLKFDVENIIFNIGARFQRMNGSETITQSLTTQNSLYPQGTNVRSDLRFDWYRFGFGYRFNFRQDQARHRFSIEPGVEGVLIDFHYKMKANGIIPNNRDYTHMGMRIGCLFVWEPTDKIKVELNGRWGAPFENSAVISSWEVLGIFRVLGEPEELNLSLVLGLGEDEIHFKDEQVIPNNLRLDVGPHVQFGLRFSF